MPALDNKVIFHRGTNKSRNRPRRQAARPSSSKTYRNANRGGSKSQEEDLASAPSSSNRFAALSPTEPAPSAVTQRYMQSDFTFRVNKRHTIVSRPRALFKVRDTPSTKTKLRPQARQQRVLHPPAAPAISDLPQRTPSDSPTVPLTKHPVATLSSTTALSSPLPEPSPLVLESPAPTSSPFTSTTTAQSLPNVSFPQDKTSRLSLKPTHPSSAPSTDSPRKRRIRSSLRQPKVKLPSTPVLPSNLVSPATDPPEVAPTIQISAPKIYLIAFKVPTTEDPPSSRSTHVKCEGKDKERVPVLDSVFEKATVVVDEDKRKRRCGVDEEGTNGVEKDDGDEDSEGEWEFVG